MPKKLTTEEFITKAISVHGSRYDYTRVEYVNAKTKITFICPKHGEFGQTPNNHLSGQGCINCGVSTRAEKRSGNTEEFIEKATLVHQGVYSYSKVDYTRTQDKVTITCSLHGDFEQSANNHLSGLGCPSCGGTRKLTTEEFITKAVEVHGHSYDYSMTAYTTAKTKLTIGCRIHGDIEITPDSHLRGAGCRQCADELLKGPKVTLKEFIDRAKLWHNDYYDYSNTVLTGMKDKIKIICPIHGEFKQLAITHAKGGGCIGCANSTALYTNFPTIVYYVKFTIDSVIKYKIGITSRDVSTRFKKELAAGYNIQNIESFSFETGRPAFKLEQFILKSVRYKKHSGYPFLIAGVGDTELFDFPLTEEELLNAINMYEQLKL